VREPREQGSVACMIVVRNGWSLTEDSDRRPECRQIQRHGKMKSKAPFWYSRPIKRKGITEVLEARLHSNLILDRV